MNIKELMGIIDWKALENKLSVIMSTPITLQVSIREGAYKQYISAKSQELIDYAGVFRAGMLSVVAETFNSDFNSDGDYWCTISLNYQAKSRGTNGVSILEALYNLETKEWEWPKHD